MKIAVTYENGMIFQHFGHTKNFKIYEIGDGKVLNSSVVDTNGTGHGALASFLKENGVEVLICGGIGGGAKEALNSADIKICAGVTGIADEAVNAYISGTLSYNQDAECKHHHEHGHSCGGEHEHKHEHGHDCGHGQVHSCGHRHEHGHGCRH